MVCSNTNYLLHNSHKKLKRQLTESTLTKVSRYKFFLQSLPFRALSL